MTVPEDSVTIVQAFLVELLISFVLVMTVMSTCDKNRIDSRGSDAFAIGFAVTACHLAAVSMHLLWFVLVPRKGKLV